MTRFPRKRRQPSARSVARRRSRRSRKSLLLVFALVFAPLAPRSGRAACVELEPLPSIPVGVATPWSVTTGDIDGDGDADTVVSAYDGDAFLWYENDGAAGAWTPHTIAAGTSADYAIQAEVVDLDGDGDNDLLASEFQYLSFGRIVWIENVDGGGTNWSLHEVSAARGVRTVTAADLDGDGDLDLAAALYFPGLVSWYENDGTPRDGGWSLQPVSNDAFHAYAVVAADFDGDGDFDLASASGSGSPVAWHVNLNGYGSAWTQVTISTAFGAGGSLAVGDSDGDGDLDLAVGSLSAPGQIAWFLNNGTPESGPWPLETVSTASGAIALAAVDFDRDGHLDLVSGGFDFTTADATSTWHENLGGGSWRDHAVVTNGTALSGVAAADLDRDGDLDLLTVDRGANQIVLSKNLALHDQPLFAPAATVVAGGGPTAAVIADLDGDGDLDLISTLYGDNAVSWFENAAPGGDGSSWSRRTISSAPAYARVAADLDGDGDLDVLATSYPGGIFWYRNLAGDASSWTRATIFSVAAGAYGAAAADVDRDGDLDAVSALQSAGAIVWHENSSATGDGSTWSTATVATVAGASAVAAGDLDGDGDPDVASVTFSGDAIYWHANLAPGDGSSWTMHTVSTIARPLALVAADLDGDGDLDLVSSSGVYTPQLTWHENVAGDGSTWSDRLVSIGLAGGQRISVGDADGDGDLDLLATAVSGDNVVWYENDGTPGNGAWTSHLIATALLGSIGVATADLDGDGDLDAASVAINIQQISWHRNLGTGVFDDGFDSDANEACWSSSVP